VKFPAISRAAFGYFDVSSDAKFSLINKPISFLPLLAEPDTEYRQHRGIGFNLRDQPPDRIIVQAERYRLSLAPIWIRIPRANPNSVLLESRFPPNWRDLCGASFAWYSGSGEPTVVWNRAHPLLRRVTGEAWKWCEIHFNRSIDPLPHRNQLLADPSKAACWLLRCISRNSQKIWEGIPERDPEFLGEVLDLIRVGKKANRDAKFLFWVEGDASDSFLRVISRSKWGVVRDQEVVSLLPTAPEGWVVRNLARKQSPLHGR
jgi:hypothetical protein